MYPFSRLIKNQQLRLQNECSANRELLLLPAGKIAATLVQLLLQYGKQIEDTLGDRPGAALANTQAYTQVFLYRQLRKNFTPLWHVPDTDPGPLLGGTLEQIESFKSDAARSSRQQPHDAFQERRLPHAVAAHQAHERASRHGKIDIPQCVATAVKLIEGFDRQQAYAPR